MKKHDCYYENITITMREHAHRYVNVSYPMSRVKHRHLLKLAEYQNQAIQGRRKYLPKDVSVPPSGGEL